MVGYPSCTSPKAYIDLYAKTATKEQAEKECKLIYKYVYKHSVMNAGRGLVYI
jgi:hypothetical protein